MGGNLGSVPLQEFATRYYRQEQIARFHGLDNGSATTLTLDGNYYPVSWPAGQTITTQIYNNNGAANPTPSYTGLWTIQYDDAYYSGGAPSATTVTLGFNNSANTIITREPGYPSVSGTTVTVVYNVQLPATTYSASLTLSVTAPSDGLWHISNLWVFAPNNTINRSNRYAVDDNVVSAFTGPTGRGPGTIRFMDSLFSFGGETNYVDASDLINPGYASWLCADESAGTTRHCRRLTLTRTLAMDLPFRALVV